MKNKKERGADSQAFKEGRAKAKEMIAADPAGAKPKWTNSKQ